MQLFFWHSKTRGIGYDCRQEHYPIDVFLSPLGSLHITTVAILESLLTGQERKC
jgi:hypothetical protein